ncbi:site-2 protease family protein [Candidatus Pacearchaeota archaeon]|nr:site-2 protease family protein [Candidatus Pacearchaeota archaeon]
MVSSFLIYDLVFLFLFAIATFYFLRSRKHNLKREGLLILYRTSWGVKLMDKIGKKHPRTFTVFSYISVATGYALMALMIYLLVRIVYLYAFMPEIVRVIKIPPLMPLVPYLPQVFELSFLPPFYFTYWIVIIAIVAITHEFAHGIFMRRYNIKIKSTGFGFFPWFLPIFLAAFVEQDEKSMKKAKKFGQLAVLSAGTFANILTGILFFAIISIFFFLAFVPAGVIFNSYPAAFVNISDISSVNGIAIEDPSYENILKLTNDSELNKIESNGISYVTTKDFIQNNQNSPILRLYLDAPAVNAQLESTIMEINGEKIYSISDLSRELSKYPPGETVTLKVLGKDKEPYNRDIVLGKNPITNSSILGISFSNQTTKGMLGKIYMALSFKNPNTFYESKIGGIGDFVYELLWWIVLISVSVALVNMLPMGIFDGGMFFYLTILSITKSEKLAQMSYKISTYLILGILLLMMFYWLVALV